MLNKSFFLNTDQIFKTLVAIIFTCFATTASSAQDNDPFEITVYGSFIHTKTVPNALFFFNKIEQYDSFEFRRALRNHDIDTVVLGSNGGSVWEGLSMAGIIHDRGIATYVPELPNDMGCYSACAFMFFGGQIRQADGVLAVHQTGYYDSERDGQKEKVSRTQQSTQFTVSEIIGFLNEFETPPWVYEKMFRSREFYEFDKEEKTLLSNREDEISSPNIYAVNGFITSFFKHLADLETKEKTTNIQQPSTLTVEQERKLLVTKIQKLLNAAGCNAGIEDGIWGRRTQAAAELFARTTKYDGNTYRAHKFLNALSASTKRCPKPKPKQNRNIDQFAKAYSVRCGSNRGKLLRLGRNSSGITFSLTFPRSKLGGHLLTVSNIKTSSGIVTVHAQNSYRTFIERINLKMVKSFEFTFRGGRCKATLL